MHATASGGDFAKALRHWGLHETRKRPNFCNPCWHVHIRHFLRQMAGLCGASGMRFVGGFLSP
jgi:hypothetical protein